MLKKYILLTFLITYLTTNAQIIGDMPPYVLTIAELKAWTETGSTADPLLIATEPLAPRFENADTQFNPELSNDMEIAYLPDGMNNFANYGEEQAQFNLYNFTNWAYIDKLVWFWRNRLANRSASVGSMDQHGPQKWRKGFRKYLLRAQPIWRLHGHNARIFGARWER